MGRRNARRDAGHDCVVPYQHSPTEFEICRDDAALLVGYVGNSVR